MEEWLEEGLGKRFIELNNILSTKLRMWNQEATMRCEESGKEILEVTSQRLPISKFKNKNDELMYIFRNQLCFLL